MCQRTLGTVVATLSTCASKLQVVNRCVTEMMCALPSSVCVQLIVQPLGSVGQLIVQPLGSVGYWPVKLISSL